MAKLAGVSIATVSRVLNGASTVNAKLSRKVWRAVAETGYVPNRHAQALVSGRTRLLGLLVADITNPFFPELVRGFEDAATKHGFSLLMGSTYGDPSRTGAWVQRMLQHGIEGLAMLTFMSEPASVYELLQNTPTVQVKLKEDFPGVESVEIDYRHGIRQAVQHLAVLGHRDIVFAAGSPEDFTAATREQNFREAMREIGVAIQDDGVFREQHTLEGGIAAAHRVLHRKQRPTAIICSNDLMAIGVLRTLQARDVHVPGEVSIIGLDDIHLSEFTTPALSTVRMPRIELAEACFENLLARLEGRAPLPAVPSALSTNLIVRESTDYPPQSGPLPAGANRKKTKSATRVAK